MRIPDEKIAVIRAACLAGFRHKLIAKYVGISTSAVEKISQGARSPEIPPDPDFDRRIRLAFCVKDSA